MNDRNSDRILREHFPGYLLDETKGTGGQNGFNVLWQTVQEIIGKKILRKCQTVILIAEGRKNIMVNAFTFDQSGDIECAMCPGICTGQQRCGARRGEISAGMMVVIDIGALEGQIFENSA